MKKIKKAIKRKRLSRKHIGALGVTFLAFALPFGIPFFGIGVGNGTGNTNQQQSTVVSVAPPQVTCIPRPPCLDSTPRCLIAEPAQGWCPPTITPGISSVLTVTPPQGCHYIMPMCPRCTTGNCNTLCKPILICPSGSPAPQPTCMPEPYCLRHAPFCYPPVPVGGWCPSPSIASVPTVTPPPGCYYQKGACPLLCSQNDPNCCNNFPGRLVCPSGTPEPQPSCIPQPPCLTHAPYCLLKVPVGQFCPPTVTITPPAATVSGQPCLPKPSCLDAAVPCKIPEPIGGWCQVSVSPVPFHIPHLTNVFTNIWQSLVSFFHF